MRKPILAVLAMGLVASLAPLSAHADHCSRTVVIFSYTGPSSLNSNVLTCIADGSEDTDGRILYPGSTQFSLRYTVDLGEETKFIFADLTGSLFPTGSRVKLTRFCDANLGFCAYDSAALPLPGGRTANGCLTATVDVPDDELATTTSKHITATC